MKKLAEKLVEIGAVRLTTPDNLFTWVSGIKSPIYCDNRLTISYPEIRGMIADEFAKIVREKYPEATVIAGTATAGIPHAAFVAERLGLPMVYVRSAGKDHGTGKLIEGVLSPVAAGGKKDKAAPKVVLVEDLFSTGKSSVAAVRALKAEGAEVVGCIGIFSYGFDAVAKAFKEVGVPFEALTGYSEILEIELAKGLVDKDTQALLSKWSKDPEMFIR